MKRFYSEALPFRPQECACENYAAFLRKSAGTGVAGRLRPGPSCDAAGACAVGEGSYGFEKKSGSGSRFGGRGPRCSCFGACCFGACCFGACCLGSCCLGSCCFAPRCCCGLSCCGA